MFYVEKLSTKLTLYCRRNFRFYGNPGRSFLFIQWEVWLYLQLHLNKGKIYYKLNFSYSNIYREDKNETTKEFMHWKAIELKSFSNRVSKKIIGRQIIVKGDMFYSKKVWFYQNWRKQFFFGIRKVTWKELLASRKNFFGAFKGRVNFWTSGFANSAGTKS